MMLRSEFDWQVTILFACNSRGDGIQQLYAGALQTSYIEPAVAALIAYLHFCDGCGCFCLSTVYRHL